MEYNRFKPFFYSPLTDITGGIVNTQYGGECADFEMKSIECLEAYGMKRGKEKCRDLLDDFKECVTKEKQFKRIMAMRLEREKQYLTGESKERYAPPPKINAY